MAIVKIEEMREFDDKALGSKLVEIKAELNRELGQVASGGRSTNPGRIKEMKREIARMLTIMHERKLGIHKKVKSRRKAASAEKKDEKK